MSRVKIDDVQYVRAKAIEGEAAFLRSIASELAHLAMPGWANRLRASADRLDLGAGGERPAPAGWDEFMEGFVRPRLLAGESFAGFVVTPEDCTVPPAFGGWKARVQLASDLSITNYLYKCSGTDKDAVVREAADWFIAILLTEQLDEADDE